MMAEGQVIDINNGCLCVSSSRGDRHLGIPKHLSP